ncbi:MAG: hypothetical protein CMM15_05010 [Rhodospirillaceae bacterium]|nr:hypothetical protein [Rhodospirillaceae bacterium]
MKTIFVSIASFRDTLCSRTIRSMFDMAKYPSRIFAGICEQNDPSAKDEICKIVEKYGSNIRKLTLHYQQAKGPTLARYYCSTLYRGEDFFLQIDSHTLFVQDWDEICIEMLKSVEAQQKIQKVILSHYPSEDKRYEERPAIDAVVPHVNDCYFQKDGLIAYRGAALEKPGRHPRRNGFVCAGFLFTRGSWLYDVPFDPHLDYLFMGEEILLSIRSFTKGWNVYTPNRNIVFHTYTRSTAPKFWEQIRYDDSQSKIKAKLILGLEKDMKLLTNPTMRASIQRYGIGNTRSRKEFYDFLGINVEKKSVQLPFRKEHNNKK